eukprot:TRINITY_DN7337_c0_g1_i4.p2 TRINITY_DN7337_c0_g1~~TRINITY_DN7337_c0_g1_i4.p2  ORF type:complete len:243 (-),score=-23.34 TRINITY_DN7337_c0_g1_i4:1557-2285(-)
MALLKQSFYVIYFVIFFEQPQYIIADFFCCSKNLLVVKTSLQISYIVLFGQKIYFLPKKFCRTVHYLLIYCLLNIYIIIYYLLIFVKTSLQISYVVLLGSIQAKKFIFWRKSFAARYICLHSEIYLRIFNFCSRKDSPVMQQQCNVVLLYYFLQNFQYVELQSHNTTFCSSLRFIQQQQIEKINIRIVLQIDRNFFFQNLDSNFIYNYSISYNQNYSKYITNRVFVIFLNCKHIKGNQIMLY